MGKRSPSKAIQIFCVLAWGSSYVAIKIGLESFTPSQVASYRFFIAGIVSLVFILVNRVSIPTVNQLFRILSIGFFGIFLYHISITYFTVHFQPNVVSFVSNTAPIFMILFSRYFLADNPQTIRWSGFVLALVGIGLMNFGKEIHLDWKQVGLLSIPVSGALFFILQKPLLRTMKSTDMMHLCIVCGALMLIAYDFSFFKMIPIASAESHIAIIFLGIIPTVLAFQLWSRLLSQTNVSNLSSPIYLVPPSTILFSFLFLRQLPELLTVIGGFLTIIGVVITKRKKTC
ncbi:MAG: EamA family transporter [Ekhidna sp.]